MRHVLYLAWRYLRFNVGKTAVLVASISLILFLPVGLQVVVRQAAEMLTARADATPLLIGTRGSAVDLTLAALYFREPTLEPMAYAELTALEESGLARDVAVVAKLCRARSEFAEPPTVVVANPKRAGPILENG